MYNIPWRPGSATPEKNRSLLRRAAPSIPRHGNIHFVGRLFWDPVPGEHSSSTRTPMTVEGDSVPSFQDNLIARRCDGSEVLLTISRPLMLLAASVL